MTQQGDRQASVRAVTGTALTYEGDWHALFDDASIASGSFNERLLLWINDRLGSSHVEINGAMQAFAENEGFYDWDSMGTFEADPTLALSHKFALDKTLSGRIGPAVTFTRASSGAYFDSSGVLQTATTNEARFDHDLSDNTSLGLLIEAAATNECTESEDFSSWNTNGTPIVTANVDGPDGVTNSAYTITLDDAAGFEDVNIATTVANDSNSSVFSIYMQKTSSSSSFPGIAIRYTGGTGVNYEATINTDDGTITGRSGSSPDGSNVQDAGSFWRVSIHGANNGTGNTTASLFVWGAVETTIDGNWEAAATGSVVVFGAQLEQGATTPTSYIATAGSTATRAVDVATFANVDWYNNSSGLFFAKLSVTFTDTSVAMPVFVVDNSATTNRIGLQKRNNASMRRAQGITSLGDDFDISSGTMTADVVEKWAVAYAEDDVAFYADGAQVGTDNTFDLCTGIDRGLLGRDAFSNRLTGHIEEIRFYNVRKDNSFLENLTQ